MRRHSLGDFYQPIFVTSLAASYCIAEASVVLMQQPPRGKTVAIVNCSNMKLCGGGLADSAYAAAVYAYLFLPLAIFFSRRASALPFYSQVDQLSLYAMLLL